MPLGSSRRKTHGDPLPAREHRWLCRGRHPTLLTVLPEGAFVKEGEVLATLDASNYEELQRQQVITVEQAKASHLQVRLDLEWRVLAVKEYRDGIVDETLKGMEGSIALARSDLREPPSTWAGPKR